MNRNEKIFLLETILRDIRGSWAEYDDLEGRILRAEELANELELQPFIDSIDEYNAEREETGDNDGRFFRMGWSYGGYINMHELHGLDYDMKTKSKELVNEIFQVCANPNEIY